MTTRSENKTKEYLTFSPCNPSKSREKKMSISHGTRLFKNQERSRIPQTLSTDSFYFKIKKQLLHPLFRTPIYKHSHLCPVYVLLSVAMPTKADFPCFTIPALSVQLLMQLCCGCRELHQKKKKKMKLLLSHLSHDPIIMLLHAHAHCYHTFNSNLLMN